VLVRTAAREKILRGATALADSVRMTQEPEGGLRGRPFEAVRAAEAKVEGDERTGIQIPRRALEAPTRQLAENSGVDGGVVIEKMREGTGNFGFDAAAGVYTDLVAAGTVDATKWFVSRWRTPFRSPGCCC
jgi:hypothetical protein